MPNYIKLHKNTYNLPNTIFSANFAIVSIKTDFIIIGTVTGVDNECGGIVGIESGKPYIVITIYADGTTRASKIVR